MNPNKKVNLDPNSTLPYRSEVKALTYRTLALSTEIEERINEYNALLDKYTADNVPPFPNDNATESAYGFIAFDLFSDAMKNIHNGFASLEQGMRVTIEEFDSMLMEENTNVYELASKNMLHTMLSGLFGNNED